MKTNASNSPNSIEKPLFTYYSELGTVSKGTLYDEPDGFYMYSLPSQDLLYDSFDSIQGQIHSRLIDLNNLIIERLFGNQSAYADVLRFHFRSSRHHPVSNHQTHSDIRAARSINCRSCGR